MIYLDQGSSWETKKDSDGTTVTVQGGIDVKTTFRDLYSTGYVPFTFAEFLGTDPIEKAEASLSVAENNLSLSTLNQASVQANYAISDITMTVTDPSGNVLEERYSRVTKCNAKTWPMQSAAAVVAFNKYANGTNIATITCRLGTGEVLTVYKGYLTK